MQIPKNLKVGDQFRVIERYGIFKVGEIVTLKEDDGGDYPSFWNADRSDYHYISFSQLEPYAKTVRDAQVGDVVVDEISGGEHLVLERLQNSVLISDASDFKTAGSIYTFNELEEYYTLKDTPEPVDISIIITMDQIAEKFGVEVSKLKIAKD